MLFLLVFTLQILLFISKLKIIANRKLIVKTRPIIIILDTIFPLPVIYYVKNRVIFKVIILSVAKVAEISRISNNCAKSRKIKKRSEIMKVHLGTICSMYAIKIPPIII